VDDTIFEVMAAESPDKILGYETSDGMRLATKDDAVFYLTLRNTISGQKMWGDWKPDMKSKTVPSNDWRTWNPSMSEMPGPGEVPAPISKKQLQAPQGEWASHQERIDLLAKATTEESQMNTNAQWYCIKCKKLVDHSNTTARISINKDEAANVRTHNSCGGKVPKYTVEQLAKLLHEQMSLLDDGVKLVKKIESEKEAMFKKNDDLTRTYWHPGSKRFFHEKETVHSGVVGRTVPGWTGKAYNLHDKNDMSLLTDHLIIEGKYASGADAKSKQKISELQSKVNDLESQVLQLQEQLKKARTKSAPDTSKPSRNIML
jgi:outer membrane murein-binding lipoprotein Lpp